MLTAAGAPLSTVELNRIDAYWRAANYLSVGQIYLMDNPLLREPLLPEHVKPRLLGHWGTTPGLNFLYAGAPAGDDLRYRPRPRRSRTVGERLAGRHLQRGVPAGGARRHGHAAAVHPVLVPRRGTEPRGARDARFDQRGRRTRLLPRARLRRRAGQPEPGRRVRDRRRRSRDRAPRDGLALEQVPRPGRRRRRPADPAPERLQDRQPDGPRPHRRRRAGLPAARLRLRAVPRVGRRRR